METYINNENAINDGINDVNFSEPHDMQPGTDASPEQPVKKKYHSSALYAASMWHNTVKHVKPPHTGGTFLPLQA